MGYILEKVGCHLKALAHHTWHQLGRVISFALCLQPVLHGRTRLACPLGCVAELHEHLNIDLAGFDGRLQIFELLIGLLQS